MSANEPNQQPNNLHVVFSAPACTCLLHLTQCFLCFTSLASRELSIFWVMIWAATEEIELESTARWRKSSSLPNKATGLYGNPYFSGVNTSRRIRPRGGDVIHAWHRAAQVGGLRRWEAAWQQARQTCCVFVLHLRHSPSQPRSISLSAPQPALLCHYDMWDTLPHAGLMSFNFCLGDDWQPPLSLLHLPPWVYFHIVHY